MPSNSFLEPKQENTSHSFFSQENDIVTENVTFIDITALYFFMWNHGQIPLIPSENHSFTCILWTHLSSIHGRRLFILIGLRVQIPKQLQSS